MSAHDLIYPGDLISYQVGPRIETYDGLLVPPNEGQEPDYWSVYTRPAVGDIAEWAWVADFAHEIDAREYAAWQAKRS